MSDGARATEREEAALDRFHEECAVVGIYGHDEAANLAYLGLYALQHRGQESAGMCTSDGQTIFTHKSMGHVADIFTASVLNGLPGHMAIGHTRYSTAGDTAVIFVGESTVTLVAATVPNFTVVPVTKPVPVMTTVSPPTVLPVAGDRFVTTGVTAV